MVGKFHPSKHQLEILDWLDRSNGNATINAVAGSGKSTTLLLAAQFLQSKGISPDDIKIIVFGKANSLDLLAKFGQEWKGSIGTLHSAGWALIRDRFFGKELRIDSGKYRTIAQRLNWISFGKQSGALVGSKAIAPDAESEFLRLLDLTRLTCTEPLVSDLEELAAHHELSGLFDFEKVAKAIIECLELGIELCDNLFSFDFSDQIYYPYKLKLKPRKPYKFLLLDECQDLNKAQLELVKSLAGTTGRILSVGDPYQAIFGFAGADNQSYLKVLEGLKAKELPLSTCYRCPKSHIELINKIFKGVPIEARPKAPKGQIKTIGADKIEEFLKSGDLIISRKTAPLISLCIKLISHGFAAIVKGRDIGAQIAKELDRIIKIRSYSKYTYLLSAIEEYENSQFKKYKGLKNEEQLKMNLQDRCEAIKVIFNAHPECRSIEDLKKTIQNLFSDENNANLTLSTIHRAKGLESNRIFLYHADDMPLRWKSQLPWQLEQEKNLLYVSLTRSKSELYLIPQLDDTGKEKPISWLP
jgi:DNA helicase II / ATP-dependent DNA helicase PcrA